MLELQLASRHNVVSLRFSLRELLWMRNKRIWSAVDDPDSIAFASVEAQVGL